MSLVALDLALGPSHEVVIVGVLYEDDTKALVRPLAEAFRPRASVLLKALDDPDEVERVVRLAPFAAGHEPLEGRAAAYVCSNFACQRPTSDASDMLALLD